MTKRLALLAPNRRRHSNAVGLVWAGVWTPKTQKGLNCVHALKRLPTVVWTVAHCPFQG